VPWLELTVAAKAEAGDWVAALLAANGHDGRVDLLPSPGADFPFTLRFHLPHDRPGGATANRIHDALDPLDRMSLVGDLEIDEVDELPPSVPLPPRRLTDRFLLLPPGVDTMDTMDTFPLRMPPSAAFGSGLHPATVATLRLLERHAKPGTEALDFGSGSGILSVALARLGLRVLAVDNDPLAVEATVAAAELNGVRQQIEAAHASLGEASRLGHWLGLGDLPAAPPIPSERRFDLVAANVLARLHGLLADEYGRVLGPGGLLVVGGFTRGEDEANVARALGGAGFTALDRTRLGDYVALALQTGPV
jgi:ribosomal protein L11 methyltransferase